MNFQPTHCRSRTILVATLSLGLGLAYGQARGSTPEASPRLYVTNEGSNDLSIVDVRTGQVVQTVAVGKRPRGVRLSPDHRRLYVAVSGSPVSPPATTDPLPPSDRSADGLVEVDAVTGKVLRTLACGRDPENLAVSPDGRLVAVSDEEAGEASIVEVASGKIVATIPTGAEPEGVGARPDGKVFYVTSEDEGTVTVIDVPSLKAIATFPAGQRPRVAAFTSDGKLAIVTGEQSKTVTFVDAQLHKVLQTLHLPGALVKPMGVAIAPDDRRAYVATGRGGTVVVVDIPTRSVVSTIPDVGKRPWGLAISRDGKRLYAAAGPSNDVAVIDVASGKVVQRINVGTRPWGVALGD
jgi:YVTN family beta-propeller protein